MRKYLAISALVLVACASSAAVWTAVKDVSGVVCPIVLQAVDPVSGVALEPLCVGLTELEATIQDMGTADAGPAGAAQANYRLYHAVIAHRANAAK